MKFRFRLNTVTGIREKNLYNNLQYQGVSYYIARLIKRIKWRHANKNGEEHSCTECTKFTDETGMLVSHLRHAMPHS